MAQEQVDIKTPEFVSIQFQTAGLGSRSAAFLIDFILLLIINIIIVLLGILVISGDVSQFLLFGGNVTGTALAVMIILIFVLNWGYFFTLEFFAGGKTVGKRLVGIRVIQENGHSITLLSSFIRNFLRIVDMLPANYFVGMIMVFFHPKHKRLGDVVGGTIVVHERKKKRNKKTVTEKEIEERGLTKTDLSLDQWQLKQFSERDWQLIKTYSNRLLQIPLAERNKLTRQTALVSLPKINIQIDSKTERELEDILLLLYLHLKDEWEYEL